MNTEHGPVEHDAYAAKPAAPQTSPLARALAGHRRLGRQLLGRALAIVPPSVRLGHATVRAAQAALVALVEAGLVLRRSLWPYVRRAAVRLLARTSAPRSAPTPGTHREPLPTAADGATTSSGWPRSLAALVL